MSIEARLSDWAVMGLPVAIVAGGAALLPLLPMQVMTFVGIWVLASFPIGMLVGHCVLSEPLSGKDRR